MKLHRLALSNYRGITHRDMIFPDHGVIVVSGPNEIGKTSMIEALDLLLEAKDRSAKKDVKQVKPTHADVGSEVLAEISTGPYRFVYRKRFHKKHETELTILEPARAQLTGDEAHERVVAMLAETVDTQLWQAQRVLQAASTSAVDLSGCDALCRALDIAAGHTESAPSGDISSAVEPLLIDRIDAQYAQYFTMTGKPTGSWAEAIAAVRDAEAEVTIREAAVADIDDRVRRHAELTQKLADLADQQHPVVQRCTAAQESAAALAELTDHYDNAMLRVQAAQASSVASVAAQTERHRLRDDIATRTGVIMHLTADLTQAQNQQTVAADTADSAAAAAETSAKAVEHASTEVDCARAIVDTITRRDEAERLRSRLATIDTTQQVRDQISDELSAIVLTEKLMDDIQSAESAIAQITAQLTSSTTNISFTATTDLELIVGGKKVEVAAGQHWEPDPGVSTTVQVPGVLSVHIDPGATVADMGAQLETACHTRDALLAQAGVADGAAARLLDQRRRELSAKHDQLAATLCGLCGDDTVADMRSRLAALETGNGIDVPAGIPAEVSTAELSLETARAHYEAIREAYQRARITADAAQRAATQAAAIHSEKVTAATVLQERLGALTAERDAAQQRLNVLRADADDEQIARRASVDAAALAEAEAAVTQIAQRRAAVNPEAIDAESVCAQQAYAQFQRDYSASERALNDITVELALIGSEGRHSALDAALSARDHAITHHARVSRRARSALLLRSVMMRHRDATRLRYVRPFRTEVQRLGQIVFGPTFDIEIDSDLRICNRTLHGRTVPYESLSGGAKEQLAILTRLAGAGIVSAEDTVPVIIDDALGFTDPQRLATMNTVFNTVGNLGQIIVLTCTPARYSGISDAHFIELTA